GIYNPRTNPETARNRRNTVINQMARNNYISAEEAEKYKKLPIQLNYKKMDENNGISPYFLEIVRDELRTWAKNTSKPSGESYDIYQDGLKIYTTINPRMQL